MANIAIEERWIDFQTDLGTMVRASRAYVRLVFTDASDNSFRTSAIFDTGAPFSVIPYSFWHDRNMAWIPLGSQLTHAGNPVPGALTWFGVPCRIGESQVRLFDKATGMRSNVLRLVAKFPAIRLPSHVEREALLGCTFLLDNSLELAMRGIVGRMDGMIAVP